MAQQTNGKGNPAHAAVVGLQWGDEGKGKIVNLLTKEYDYIVRYNGGANAGHSVVIGDQRYALHLIPSGIMMDGKINVIGNGVVIDPAGLLDEAEQLTGRGVSIGDNLRISNRAHIVMSYHKLQDALTEAAVSAAQGKDKAIGTTGRGIGPCYADKATRSTALRMGDLLDKDKFTTKLRYIVELKNAHLQSLASVAGEKFEPFDAGKLAKEYLVYGRRLAKHICDSSRLLHKAMDEGEKLLFEGANGCMLDIDHGTYPFVTSSNCGTGGIYSGTGVPGGKVGRKVGIMKAYTTRVGGGPFPTELHDDTGQRIRERGKEYGTTTGRPRRCGWLDLAVISYSARINGVTELAVMLLDVLAGLDKLNICSSYTLDGKPLDCFPADADDLDKIQPVYTQVEGFADEITECKSFDQLPATAQRYVQMIEDIVKVKVSIVSIGPERSQTIMR